MAQHPGEPEDFENWPIVAQRAYGQEMQGTILTAHHWGLIVDLGIRPILGFVDGLWAARMHGDAVDVGDTLRGFPVAYRAYSKQVELIPAPLWAAFLAKYPDRANWIALRNTV